MEQTYKGKINEFVDWITGDNEITGQNQTDGLKVSGGSIRDLLHDRLKSPFVMKEDVDNNLYRMFSSEDAYQLWLENPSDYADLELFNFARPSDYKLDITINSSNRFVRYGDSSNLGTRIQYTWSIRNDEGESADGLSATYTISNESSGKSTTFTRWYNKGQAVDFSIYEYLEPGNNTVTIQGKGSTTGARNTITFNVALLQLNVISTFDFAAKHSSGDSVLIPCTFTRNNQDGTAKVYFQFDDQQPWSTDILKNTGTQINVNQRTTLNLSPGQHVLQIWAEAQYNDGSVTILSNLLYFTFVIATPNISTQKYICVAQSINSASFPLNELVLDATQYMAQTLRWGYYTDAKQTDTQISVTWKLFKNDEDPSPETLSVITANTGEESDILSYIPSIYSEYDSSSHPLTFLQATWNNVELIRIPVQIVQNADIKVYETPQYSFKLSAYGKTNESPNKAEWKDSVGEVTTTFTGIQWNPNSGWYGNSFRTSGTTEYATVNYEPFDGFSFLNGKTIEIEFETEKVVNDDDKLIIIGNPEAGRIEITPTKASLYSNGNDEIVFTNYKANERIKLAFILNDIPEDVEQQSVQSGLAYIVNNGILERAANAGGAVYNNHGKIKIGGSTSGVRVYNMRIYNYAITYTDAFNNYVYDSADKLQIVNANDVLDTSNEISFDLCKNKLDTILISGDLSKILSGQTDKEDSTTDVTIERYCPYDSTKNFKINNAQIRKHGQSTLNYPITSMKIWLNKSKSGVQPIYEITPQDKVQFNKNRYRMKDTSIPSNKFVLQANYADSSGVHNGGFERLIQQSWYNAVIDGEYKLRTIPQLFATNKTVTHNDPNLHDQDERVDGLNEYGKQWGDYTNTAFPYEIRVSPDSFPCAVFYYDTAGTQKRTFLGQYVFMDDKKSDFLYGERSIYKIAQDPFCLTVAHAKDDKKQNRVWNNGDVLRIEVLESNNQFSSYMSTDGFTDIVNIVDEKTGMITGRRYNWEGSFEAIYPDPDDMAEDDAAEGKDKFDPDSEFVKKTQPFIDWYTWLVSTRNNQSKFEQEAAQHLDLYKMAAYYICLMRFGLVDSLERNAQIKTYDGVHFHYEPWDMDIALGNKNDGGIAYNPPIDRDTKLPGSVTTYAFSGRSDNAQGQRVTSNWLFDALEAWPYWMNTIVPKVANALFNAGLSYTNISNMFDNVYMSAWCETLYNKSGFFKYIESGNGDPVWLSWLQGARATHRHWWLSTSMDYYDAKWFCGDYKNHYIYITANVPENSGEEITIVPNKATYMTIAKNYIPEATRAVSQSEPLVYEVPALNTKVPFQIYGANFMESIDLSQIATGLDAVDINGVYSDVLGSPLKELNIGSPVTVSSGIYTATAAALGGQIKTSQEAIQSLQTLNVRCQRNFTDTMALIYNNNLSELSNLYAMGSGLTNFFSSRSGNKFNNIELPSTISMFEVHNTIWNNLTFWDCTEGQNNTLTMQMHAQALSEGTSNVPANIQTLKLLGTSCQNLNSLTLVREWLKSIVAAEGTEGLANHYLEADKIYWSEDSVDGAQNLLTFEELELIAQLGGDVDPDTGKVSHNLKGYIVLKNEDDTELTPQQLTQIKEWFGDQVFNRNSSGLVIDHKLEYVQINVGGDIYVENDELYMHEGGRISLTATRFSLAEDAIQGDWYVGPKGGQYPSKGWLERNIAIIDPEQSGDGITYMQSGESQAGGNYDITVYVTIAGVSYSADIHMIGVTYPDDLSFSYNLVQGLSGPRVSDGQFALWANNTGADVYVDFSNEYSATLKNITYKIQSSDYTATYNKTLDIDTFGQWGDLYMSLAKGSEGLQISCLGGAPQDDTIYEYTITVTLLFLSNRKIELSTTAFILNDSRIIVSSFQTQLYAAIKTRWEAKYGRQMTANNLYRMDLMPLDGALTISNITTLLTYETRATVLKYLPNINSITITNSPNLPSTDSNIEGTNKSLFRFEYMPNLQVLDITNCTGLTEDIDLSTNTEILQVDASGTSLNVILPQNPKVTKYELGTPTEIVIDSPTVLAVSGVTVDSTASLDSLEIKNIPNNKTFTMFGKITEA